MVILIAEPELSTRRCLNLLFKKAHNVLLCEDGSTALKQLESSPVDLVLVSENLPLLSGPELIHQGKQLSSETAFVILYAENSPSAVERVLPQGADDYFLKPIDVSEVELRIRKIEELRSMKIKGEFANHLDSLEKFLIGVSSDIEEAKIFINASALADSPVVLSGPAGAGKKHIARLIHESGPRAIYPFITVNCANIDADYVDADIFGYEKGAFRGAQGAKAGKLEFARGGTLLLENIEGLSLQSQGKLTRFLKERYFERLGSERKIHSNVRLIALSEDPLPLLVAEARFDGEFLAHLNILSFEMSGLSSRREDIPLLIEYFCEKARKDLKRPFSLDPKTIHTMSRYAFPGNTKELQNTIERLAIANQSAMPLPPERLPIEFHQPLSEITTIEVPIVAQAHEQSSLEERVETFELDLILSALEKTKNDEHQAAILLRISHSTLVEKLKKFGLQSNIKKGTKAA